MINFASTIQLFKITLWNWLISMFKRILYLFEKGNLGKNIIQDTFM